MMKQVRLCCAAAFLALFACVLHAAPQNNSAGPANDASAVRGTLSGLSAADNAGDLDGVVSHYREDAILLPPNAVVVTGKPAIRGWYEQGLFRLFRPDVRFDADEVEVLGDWAFVRGYINGRLNPKADAPLVTLHEKYLMLLRRDEDGWKIARLIWNSDEPRPAPAK